MKNEPTIRADVFGGCAAWGTRRVSSEERQENHRSKFYRHDVNRYYPSRTFYSSA